MSKLRATITNTGRNQNTLLDFTEFAGPKGVMLQITQGAGTQIDPDEPGFIQLTEQDAYLLIKEVASWLKDETHRRAEELREQIAADEALQKTIFQDAVKCEYFIQELKVLEIPVRLLS